VEVTGGGQGGGLRPSGSGDACSASLLKEEEVARWAEWAKRLNRPMGQLGRVGP
jgi:hypothetical protein